MKAISIKQPWASLIVHGIKDIENRTWKCPEKYIGQRVLVHASGKPLQCIGFLDSILKNEHISALPKDKEFEAYGFEVGAIIGSVKIVGCTVNHSSIWAEKTPDYVTGTPADVHKFVTGEKVIYNWILAEPILFEVPIPAKGKLSFWDAHVEEMKIECPECGCVQIAVVDHTTVPFSSYVHECQNCAYLITESDWNEVK